ncbi:MAG: cytochrome c biogenesis protein [Chloroflexi bacterium]|nr:cytochrome c biogenesis protein [Chloroflexota bacterium]MCY3938453.1 cytochrome c biogenesis protein [Chloroflexota bacterium]
MDRSVEAGRPGLLRGAGASTLVLWATTAIAMAAALYMMFLYAPTEAVQGDLQRLFYVHMSTALIGYVGFFVTFLAGAIYLARGSVRWDRLARASAIIGVVFITIVLITGCLWGTKVWGACWTWDPRLTTTLILWFIYVGYLMLRGYVDDPQARMRLAAIVGIVGFVVVPINYMSVYWWRSLHPQATVLRPEGPGLSSEMLITLLVTMAAFLLLYVVLLRLQLKLESLIDELGELRFRRLLQESDG